MKYFISTLLTISSFLAFVSCKKGGTDTGGNQAPANLNIVTNITTDGSGTVSFTATADNTVKYDFELGNGDIKSSTSGQLTYKYSVTGNHSYQVTVTATGKTGLSTKKTVPVSVNVTSTTPGLFWSEEFNTDGAPDPTKWGYDIGTGSGGWGNAELEYYTSRPQNVIVQGGVLKIHALKENYSGSPYTSARVLSKDKFAFTYGKVEVRAKIPAGVGTWPAIWMLGSNIGTVGWPACGEIDIMEHRGSELNKIFGTLHYPGHFGGSANGNTKTIANATTEFHIYTLEWSASSIKIYADDQLVHTVNNSNSIPFNHDFFLILNVAIGGTFAGPVDPALTNATMEVDYIRVYK